jgi:YD repeat-containing protein
LQEVLLPAFKNDEVLKELVKNFKTFDPNHGLGKPAFGKGPEATGQGAKAFTIYADSPETAARIQKRVDEIISQHADLVRPKPFETGNVDNISGKSNRVGLSRDTFPQSRDSQPGNVLARMDDAVSAKILSDPSLSAFREFGSDGLPRMKPEGLRVLETKLGLKENALHYDSEGKLSIKVSGHDDYKPRSVYVDEGKAETHPRGERYSKKNADGTETSTQSEGLTDRPAIYKLYKHYGMDPADVALGNIQPSVIHDARGQIRQVRDSAGQVHSFEYDAQGKLSKAHSDGMFIYERQSDGSWTRRQESFMGIGSSEKIPGHLELESNGTMRWQEKGGDLTVTSLDGTVSTFDSRTKLAQSSLSPDGTTTTYEHGPGGKVTTLTIEKDGHSQVWSTKDGTTWTVHDSTKPDVPQTRSGSIEIAADGSARRKVAGHEAKPISLD